MKVLNGLLKQPANTLVLIFLSPLLLCFLSLLIFGNKHDLAHFLAAALLARLGLHIAYTNGIARRLSANLSPKKLVSYKRIWWLGSLSLLSALALSSAVIEASLITLLLGLLVLPASELLRCFLVARLIIKQEGHQYRGAWLYLSTLFIVLYPLLGIWALEARLRNAEQLANVETTA